MFIGAGLAIPAIAALGRRAPDPGLIAAGYLSPLLTLTRAQSATVATGTDVAGALVEYPLADTPRWTGAAQRLLIETQRTNLVRNPRCEGVTAGVVGSGGSLPSNGWAVSLAVELVTEVLGAGTEAGVPYVDLRISGTPSSSPYLLLCDSVAGPSLTQHIGSAWVRRIAGSLTNISSVQIRSGVAGGTGTNQTTLPTGAELGSLARYSLSVTPGSGATSVNFGLALNVTSGQPVDLSLRLGGPQLEVGAAVSSLILPPVGSPAAATRGQDFVTGDATAIFSGSAGTILFTGALHTLTPPGTGGVQHIVQLDQGNGGDNRIVWRFGSSGTATLLRTTAGAAASANMASVTAGALFRGGIAWDGTGRAVASLNGGAAVEVTGAVTSLTTLRIGSNAASGGAMHGEIGPVDALPRALSDADLAAATAL